MKENLLCVVYVDKKCHIAANIFNCARQLIVEKWQGEAFEEVLKEAGIPYNKAHF